MLDFPRGLFTDRSLAASARRERRSIEAQRAMDDAFSGTAGALVKAMKAATKARY